jgi:SH3-like domain-containing protein
VDNSQKKYRIPRIQSIESKKVNKLKGPGEDASIPFGREKKAITGEGRVGET